jgi:hypothetical protein
MQLDVVLCPHPLIGGHGYHEVCIVVCDTVHLGQSAQVVIDVLEHVAREEKVECVVPERKRTQSAGVHVLQATQPAELDSITGCVHPCGRTERAELDEVSPRAAACVEEAGSVW